uniref:Profilin n=1 Tax=Panagrellus redivivus TaxID=6233 RepID=A0A7E4US52_PANRE
MNNEEQSCTDKLVLDDGANHNNVEEGTVSETLATLRAQITELSAELTKNEKFACSMSTMLRRDFSIVGIFNEVIEEAKRNDPDLKKKNANDIWTFVCATNIFFKTLQVEKNVTPDDFVAAIYGILDSNVAKKRDNIYGIECLDIPDDYTDLQKDILQTVCAVRLIETQSKNKEGTTKPNDIMLPILISWNQRMLIALMCTDEDIKKAAIVGLDGSIWVSTTECEDHASKGELKMLISEFNKAEDMSSKNITYEGTTFAISNATDNVILCECENECFCAIRISYIIIVAVFKKNSDSAFKRVKNFANELAENGY